MVKENVKDVNETIQTLDDLSNANQTAIVENFLDSKNL